MQKPYLGQNLTFKSAGVKRSRSTKSNQIFPPPNNVFKYAKFGQNHPSGSEDRVRKMPISTVVINW